MMAQLIFRVDKHRFVSQAGKCLNILLKRPNSTSICINIGTEHLLLGLLREENEPGGQILRKSGVTLEKARELVKQLLAEEQTTLPEE